jgi:serine/threonine-protein kinase SRPK3
MYRISTPHQIFKSCLQDLARHNRAVSIKTAADRLDLSIPIEEETLHDYKPERFFPVKLGQVFKDRYQTISKLGYGSASTVWLCRDLVEFNKYTALKVYVNSSKKHRELGIYQHVQGLSSDHAGRCHIRELLDCFEISGPYGRHVCLVHEPLGVTLDEVRDFTQNRVFDEDLVRQIFRPILTGFGFLHNEAQVIHTGKSNEVAELAEYLLTRVLDLQPNNILMGIHDIAVLERVASMASTNPVPMKELPDRIIYVSQPMPLTKGLPFLTDFSEAQFGSSTHTGLIMPNVYRAPEVILGMEWGYPVDIWSFGMTVSPSLRTVLFGAVFRNFLI